MVSYPFSSMFVLFCFVFLVSAWSIWNILDWFCCVVLIIPYVDYHCFVVVFGIFIYVYYFHITVQCLAVAIPITFVFCCHKSHMFVFGWIFWSSIGFVFFFFFYFCVFCILFIFYSCGVDDFVVWWYCLDWVEYIDIC